MVSYLFCEGDKKCRALPEGVRKAMELLATQSEELGPVRGDWPNYSKLGPRRHHCHIKKGDQPTSRCGKSATEA